MNSTLRVQILCEDRLTERFLTRLCKRFDIRVVHVEVAPQASGSASAWVAARYPDLMRLHRSKNYQKNLALIVHIDGDDRGVTARKTELDSRLTESSLPARAPHERVALLVPTWCIETWMLHLAGIAQPPEDAKLKRDPDPQYRQATRTLEEDGTAAIRAAVAAWPSTAVESLADGNIELGRVRPDG